MKRNNKAALDLLFYREFSKNFVKQVNAVLDDVDYESLTDKKAEEYRDIITKKIGYFVKPSELFNRITRNFSDRALLLGLKSAFENIEESAKTDSVLNLLRSINLSLNQGELNNIVKWVKDIPEEKEELIKAVQELLNDYIREAGKRRDLSVITPEMTKLLSGIVIDSSGKLNSIYSPNVGAGEFFFNTEIIERVKDFSGEEKEEDKLNLGKRILNLAGVDLDHINFVLGDTLTEPLIPLDKKFDCIISLPPIGRKWESESNLNLRMDRRFSPAGALAPKARADLAYVMDGISHLSEDGIALFLVSPGVLSRTGNEEIIRKYLVDNNLVEAVINLPEKSIYPNPELVLLVLKKNRDSNSVLMIQAEGSELTKSLTEKILKIYQDKKTEPGFSRDVQVEEIKKADYLLLPPYYIIDDESQSFKESATLGDLTKRIALGVYRPLKDKKGNEVFVITIGNLSSEIINSTAGLTKEISDQTRSVKPGEILASRIALDFKISMVNIKNPSLPVLVSANIYTIEVDEEKINPYYLLAFLNSELCKKQLTRKNISAGVLRNVSLKTLKNLTVPLIPLKEQEKIGQDYLNLIDQKLKLNTELENADKEIKNFSENFKNFV